MRIYAHRGLSGLAPQNTMSAVKLALSDERISGIEIDVQQTIDGKVVVCHDYLIDELSTGKGILALMTYDELLKYDFGIKFDEKFKGERAPLLSEVLEEIADRKELVIEIKKTGVAMRTIEEEIVKLLKGYKNVRVKSFYHPSIKKISELDSSISLGLLYEGFPYDAKAELKKCGADFISLHYAYVNKENIGELIKDYDVYTWTVNDKFAYNYVKEASDKVNVITNNPDYILEVWCILDEIYRKWMKFLKIKIL